MKRAKNPRRSGPPLSEELLYRHPMSVVEIHSFPRCHGAPAYPVCPRCEKTMEREYTDFCSRCGQMLDWPVLPARQDCLRGARPRRGAHISCSKENTAV